MMRGFTMYSIIILLFLFYLSAFSQNTELVSEQVERSAGSYLTDFSVQGTPISQHQDVSPAIPPFLNPSPESLPLIRTIEAINFDEEGTTSGGVYHIPPDPWIAVGPNHLVNVVNTVIEWYTKDGTRQHRESLKSFFSSVSSELNLFDPKVLYDQYEDRFVLVAFDRNPSEKRAQILVAVSQDSDPNNGWYFLLIDAMEHIGLKDCWVDYPGFALDEEAIYITGNMFPFTGVLLKGVRLWIIEKGANNGGFYAGGPANWAKYDPYAEVGQSTAATTTTPAHIFGGSSNFGTFLIAYSGFHNSENIEYVVMIRVDNPINSPTFTWAEVTCGNIDESTSPIPDAPQKDSNELIDIGDRRILKAVWYNNYLYAVAHTLPEVGPDAGQATAHWFQFNTSNLNNPTLEDQGNIGGEDIATNCYTFYPTISVDKHGNLGIGFCASAATIYPGAYYTGRRPGDTAGEVQPSQVFKTGIDYYYRTFGSSRNRWGDYTGIALDPVDQETFWLYNEYASSRGSIFPAYPSEDGRWGTALGSFSFQTFANVKIFLEGPYDAASGFMSTALKDNNYLPLTQPYSSAPWSYAGDESVSSIPENVVDWVLVELRSGTEASSQVAQRAGFLLNDGRIVDLDGSSYLRFEGILPGDYYVVVRHRNHLDVMSANPTTLWANPALYDFSTTNTNFYGDAAKHLDNGVYGMYAGDADGNGQVQTSDKNDYWWLQTGTAGYKSGDFDLNGQVQTSDKNDYWWNNTGVGSAVPE